MKGKDMAPRPKKGKRLEGEGWSFEPASDVPPPAPPPPSPRVRPFVRLEKRAKGKSATVVGGLPLTPEAWAALAKTLKAACGAGGTAHDTGLEIQGDQRETVRSALERQGWPIP